jgi:hypothetical protein
MMVPSGDIRPSSEQVEGDGVRGHDDLTSRLTFIVNLNNSVHRCKLEYETMTTTTTTSEKEESGDVEEAKDDNDKEEEGEEEDDEEEEGGEQEGEGESKNKKRQLKRHKLARSRRVAVARVSRRMVNARRSKTAMRQYYEDQLQELKHAVAAFMDGSIKVNGVAAPPLNAANRSTSNFQYNHQQANGGGGGGGGGGNGGGSGRSETEPRGIRQRLVGKWGRYVHNAQGRRLVNATRTVIIPDLDTPIDTVRAPVAAMDKLTQPTPSFSANLHMLLQSTRRPRFVPGTGCGKYVVQRQLLTQAEQERELQLENRYHQQQQQQQQSSLLPPRRKRVRETAWRKRDLRLAPEENRKVSLVPGDIVGCGIREDDVLLVNRQPSLHKPSIIAAKVRRTASCQVPGCCYTQIGNKLHGNT